MLQGLRKNQALILQQRSYVPLMRPEALLLIEAKNLPRKNFENIFIREK